MRVSDRGFSSPTPGSRVTSPPPNLLGPCRRPHRRITHYVCPQEMRVFLGFQLPGGAAAVIGATLSLSRLPSKPFGHPASTEDASSVASFVALDTVAPLS